jgi:hypothetical protein
LFEQIDGAALAELPEPAKADVLLACAEYANSLTGALRRRTKAREALMKLLMQHNVALLRTLPDNRKGYQRRRRHKE